MSNTTSPTVFMPATDSLTDPVTDRVRATWTAGDFGRIAVGYAHGAAEFIHGLAIDPGSRVLDVACGTGNLSIPAARAGAITTGIDIAPNLIEQAIRNAAAARLSIAFEVGDAEALPFADGSFDRTVTMFGSMFAARPDRAAAELLRVTRAGGRIAMANWTSTGFIGQMLRIVVGYAPPPAGAASVLQWGDENIVRERLTGAQHIECERRRIMFDYPFTPAETVQLFREWYGPTVRAFATLDARQQQHLEHDLTALWSAHNVARGNATRVDSEYLRVVAVR